MWERLLTCIHGSNMVSMAILTCCIVFYFTGSSFQVYRISLSLGWSFFISVSFLLNHQLCSLTHKSFQLPIQWLDLTQPHVRHLQLSNFHIKISNREVDGWWIIKKKSHHAQEILQNAILKGIRRLDMKPASCQSSKCWMRSLAKHVSQNSCSLLRRWLVSVSLKKSCQMQTLSVEEYSVHKLVKRYLFLSPPPHFSLLHTQYFHIPYHVCVSAHCLGHKMQSLINLPTVLHSVCLVLLININFLTHVKHRHVLSRWFIVLSSGEKTAVENNSLDNTKVFIICILVLYLDSFPISILDFISSFFISQ